MSRVPPRPLPLPNFPVPSSYKNGNCLSIPTSLGHFRQHTSQKVAASLCGIWSRPETRAETRLFLKSETKTDRKAAVKITLRYKRSSAFCEKGKSARKEFRDEKERSFDLLSFQGRRIDVGANKPKLRRFEIRVFWDKMRSFCTISASTFWKIQPEDGNETVIFRRFRLFRSRFDCSDCESPSKCFVLSNFDIPAY